MAIPNLQEGQYLTRDILEAQANPELAAAYTNWQPKYGESEGDKQNYFPDATAVSSALHIQKMLDALNQYGVNSTAELPPEAQDQLLYGGRTKKDDPGSFLQQLGSFATSPPVLIAAGGLAGMGAFSGAAAGAGTEAAATYGAGGEFGGAAGGAYGGGTATAAGGGATLADASWGVNPQTASTGLGEESMFSTGSFGSDAGVTAAAGMGSPGLGGFTGPATTGGYQFPWYDAMKGALGVYLSGQQAKDLESAMGQAANRADPFFAQRPQYQEQFQGLTSSPSGFFQDPAIADIIDFQTGATERRLASQGYNMSGNFGEEVARTGMREAFGQYLPYSRMIGEAAGAFQGTQGAGGIAGQGALQGSVLQGQQQAGIGSVLEQIFRGQQPTAAQQAQGMPRNQNLYETVFL